ncbi:vWA domain-containing protein [Achromobacter ruhlandii]|uniref:vWA domain-containing protein n=1 Tax=Achromobacter ruhlandii TaxID=72557 RepID=UPI000C26258A|nr:vWA domain-containing protein [Achromobacter ruhlandii]PJM90301.1 serine/threonine protein kinase [Achromobacter ruhlandii]
MRKIALALSLVGLASVAHAAPPLLQEGKKTLYQRVLTTPGCALHDAPGGAAGAVQPTFSRFYVYASRDVGGKAWIQIGPDSFGKTLGWLDRSCTVDWKMQMSLAFTNPAGRDRTLFFKDRPALDSVLNAIDPVEKIAPTRLQLKTKGQAPGIVAQEPELFVDMAKNFYLLPILGGEEVMTEQNVRVRVLNVASVSAGNAADAAKAGQDQSTEQERTKQIKEFSAAVVFVIDSTVSMDPYIERTREAVKKVYAKVEAERLGDKVKFGLVAFRSSTKAVPGLEYVSKIYADPNKIKDGADFMSKVADLKQAKVSSSLFDEDAYAGVMDAINSIDWRPYGARYVVLITDAGAIEGTDKLSSTGMSASQVRLEAAKPGVAIYTLHLKTPAGVKNHAHAEAQYRNLSTYGGTNLSLYYPVNAGDVNEFGKKVDALSEAITQQVKSAYQGEDAVGSAANATDPGKRPLSPDEKLAQDAALVGNAMKLAYLGEHMGTKAPPVFQAWISDRDLIKQTLPTTDVRVLLTKGQLSDLNDVMKKIVDAANQGLISPTDMFNQLRNVAATMGADPNQLQKSGKKLSEMGFMKEYLEGLPYQSEVLNLDEETWKSWDGLAQEKFIRNLATKLRHYQVYNADVDRWVSLAPNSDPRDHVYPVPLEMMP